MSYSLKLVQSGLADQELARAEQLFRAELDRKLGGSHAVVRAYQACFDVIGPDSRVPVLPGASYAQQTDVQRWRAAVAAGFAVVYGGFKFEGSGDELAAAVGAAHVRIDVHAAMFAVEPAAVIR